MKLADRSQLLPYLRSLGAAPLKRMSQNFLVDKESLNLIVATSAVKPGDRILEIGPGPGVLTEALLAKGADVTAIEADPLFARGLKRLAADIVEGDALKISWPLDCAHIVANLPYHITTPLLIRMCLEGRFQTATLLVQREVAERLTSPPGTRNTSALSVFLSCYATPRLAGHIARTCFYPAPQVDSAILHLTFHKPPLKDMEPFHTFVRRAFQQRRKMLVKSLESVIPKADMRSALASLSLSETIRPENLTLEQWLALYQITCHKRSSM